MSNQAASGIISSPRGTVTGALMASVTGADPDGLHKVSLVFVPNGEPHVLCEDGTATPCPGTFGSWTPAGLDPTAYGVSSGGGSVTLGLWVQDDLGWVSLVAQETFTWSPTSGGGPSGQILNPSGSFAGDVFVRVRAADPDGLARVTVRFVPTGTEVVMCDPCSGTSGDWILFDVDPAAYGASAGPVTTELWVRDNPGAEEHVATQPFDWQPASAGDPVGQLTSPNDLVTGDVMISAAAGDPDGLERVTVELVPGGGEVVLCSGVADPCLGYEDSWRKGSIDPGAYGVSGAGQLTYSLWVTEDGGSQRELATQHTFDWEPAALRGSTGTISPPTTRPDGNLDFSVTVRDPDGLHVASLVFVPQGAPLRICNDGGSDPCPTGTGNVALTAEDVDPRAYGASPGTITAGLWVQDDTGRVELVDDHTFTWQPPVDDGVLAVTPGTDAGATGEEGGPFSSVQDYEVANSGGSAIDYGVAITYAPQVGEWLNATNRQGQLDPSGSETMSLSINSTVANGLAAGTYIATLLFENQTNGNGTTQRTVTLTVEAGQVLPP
ncbi:MAG: hypothetical protein GY842_18440, partial [bacterium]|nr:hypothetical protein [bacterium]